MTESCVSGFWRVEVKPSVGLFLSEGGCERESVPRFLSIFLCFAGNTWCLLVRRSITLVTFFMCVYLEVPSVNKVE